MRAKKRRVMERGFDNARSLLLAVHASGRPQLMNEINIGEVCYITAKNWSIDQAEDFLHRLETLPIKSVANPFADVLEAARTKT